MADPKASMVQFACTEKSTPELLYLDLFPFTDRHFKTRESIRYGHNDNAGVRVGSLVDAWAIFELTRGCLLERSRRASSKYLHAPDAKLNPLSTTDLAGLCISIG